MYTGAAKIIFKTVDVSELVPVVSMSVGAIVLDSQKGETKNPILITNKAQFIDEYGEPTLAQIAKHAALGFLNYGNRLYVQRVVEDDAGYAGCEIKIEASGEVNAGFSALQTDPDTYVFGTDGCLAFFAKNPGVWGNDIGITISPPDANHIFMLKVWVKDAGGNYPSSPNEEFSVSRYPQKDGYGNSKYIEDVINGVSNYIIVRDNTAVTNTVDPKAQSPKLAFLEGVDGSDITSPKVVLGWDKFTNKQDYSVNILINGGFTDLTVQTKMKGIAEARIDCTCVLDVPYTDCDSVTDLAAWRVGVQHNFNTSFCALYAPWIKVFDEYNGQIVTIPPSGDIAGIYALTDYIYGAAHGAPAGYNRGILGRALRLDFNDYGVKKAFTDGEMDTLDANQINPLYNDPGFGIVVYGEETEQSIRSALSNVHVRRLINQVCVSTTGAAKGYLFEPLIERTYFRVRMAMEQYFAELEGLGAFDNTEDRGWKVVCDATNNDAADRDRNQLNVWLFIKPVKVAKYIEIKAIITRSTASFEAIVTAGIVA